MVNGFINKVQTTQDGLLKLKVHTKKGDKNLLITKEALFTSNSSVPAKQNPGGFSAFLKKFLFNQRIISITQKGVDRIVIFEFPDYDLILELFAKGNLILIDKNKKIARALKKEKWKDRELAIGEEYKFPSSQGISPLDEKETDFVEQMQTNSKTAFGAVVEILNVSPKIIEFIFEENKLDKKTNANELDKKVIKKLLKDIQKIYSSDATTAYVYKNTLYSVELNKEKEQKFESLNAALNFLVKDNPSTKEVVKEIKVEKKTDNYSAQIEQAKVNEVKFKEVGNEIYSRYTEINQIIDAVNAGKKKGLTEKEIKSKINGVKRVIKDLNFKKNKLILEL